MATAIVDSIGLQALRTGLPASEDAERMLLAAVLCDPEKFPHISAAITRDDFSLERHGKMYAAMLRLYEAGTSITTFALAHELRAAGELFPGDVANIGDLPTDLATVFDVDGYVKTVKDKAILRRAVVLFAKYTEMCLQPGMESPVVLQQMTNAVETLESECIPKHGLQQVGEGIRAIDNFFQPNRRPRGVIPHWPSLRDTVREFRPGDLILLAGRPSKGKSVAAADIARHAAANGKLTAVFSLEMEFEDLARRIVSGEASVPMGAFYRPDVSDGDRADMWKALEKLDELPMFIDASSHQSIATIRTNLRRLVARQGELGLVVIDYLGLIESATKAENRQQEVSRISRDLKRMAKEFQCPFLVLCQLSRQAVMNGPDTKTKQRPELHHLRESGSLEQDADVVIFVHREGEEGQRTTGWYMKFIVAKQRNGPTCQEGVGLWFNAMLMRFEDRTEEEPPVAVVSSPTQRSWTDREGSDA